MKTLPSRPVLLVVTLVAVIGSAAAMMALDREPPTTVVVEDHGPAAQPVSAGRFILPDDQLMLPVGGSTSSVAPPVMNTPVPNGPLSSALASEVRAIIGFKFVVKNAFDVPAFSAATVVLESEAGTIVINSQTLPKPLAASSVVNSGDPNGTQGDVPTYEARPDGAVIVSQASGNDVVVGAARTDGAFVRMQAYGVQKGPSPLALSDLRSIVLHQLGLS